ncbi:hypothetical protein Lepto7375DRAFT_5334 [Leptolyngbya sp. PCC 7375]|nr:hypothetical protein Lepto7375DRAFT_5334 [Leptolyngbya sp. PCC 7375]
MPDLGPMPQALSLVASYDADMNKICSPDSQQIKQKKHLEAPNHARRTH